MEAFDFGFEGWELFFDGFDEQHLFARRFHLPFPAIDRLHWAKNDCGAGCQALADYFAGDAAGFDDASASDQNDASGF